MEKDDDSNAFSPSFSTYSGNRISDIAERVSRTFIAEEDGFEFATLQSDSSTDGGGRGVIFPVFNQSLIPPETVITPLKDLFLREVNEQPPQQTCSSSSDEEEEEDEFDAMPTEIYCPWTPARSEMSPNGGCRKSKSTGSSSTKRWRIRDLLKRSNSDGKQSLKFLNTNIQKSSKKKESVKKKKEKVVTVSAHEKFYLRKKEEEKRKSYLPYKQELVGIFSNINRYGKTFPPF